LSIRQLVRGELRSDNADGEAIQEGLNSDDGKKKIADAMRGLTFKSRSATTPVTCGPEGTRPRAAMRSAGAYNSQRAHVHEVKSGEMEQILGVEAEWKKTKGYT